MSSAPGPFGPPGYPGQREKDIEHLRLLSIFHYVVGGFSCLCSCFPFIHLFAGILMVAGGMDNGRGNGGPPPAFMGWIFIGLAGLFILIGWTFSICIILAGKYLREQTHHTFCLVIAGLCCLNVPFGTLLGVFTLVVLLRPSVNELFVGRKPPGWGDDPGF